jgi:hypothetical protein
MFKTESTTARSRERDPQQTAKSFYGTLNNEGFTPEQVIALANNLLGLVADDLVDDMTVIAAK